MTQKVASFQITDPSGIGTVDMAAAVENYSDSLTKSDFTAEERYEQTPELHATPWRTTLEATDYALEVGWYATQEAAVDAAIATAKATDDLIGEVESIPYIAI